ncbi:hypothetical protein GGQ73_001320 [Rhizobium skierniewicense]|uniref:DUF3617 family protein n=1 Tax=Rhizobium skierniewicense TaxID=984260 RepID=A0A7W6C420_9HYPH|nr:hypothetical protein [Rhizobium skierniewicense]MBB3945387.1 hypothetical protein [Rhizobium skierniewicense]
MKTISLVRLSVPLALSLLATPGLAQETGLPTGLWQVRLFTPIPTPELKNDEQVFQICYNEAAAKAHMNPVLPKAQASKCDLDFTDMGDLAYDASCKDGDHRLRISKAAEGLWRGTYRFVGKAPDTMLEPAVELKKIADTCQ